LTKCWRTGPRKERRGRRRRRRRERKEVKRDLTEIMNERDLDRANESDRDLGTEVEEIGAEGGETEVEMVGVEEIEVGRRETEAETETDEGGAEGRIVRREGIDLEREGAAGVEIEADDVEVLLVAVVA